MIEMKWGRGINDRQLKEEICEIGRRVYNKGFAAANDGNISILVGENAVLCSPTMICKVMMALPMRSRSSSVSASSKKDI